MRIVSGKRSKLRIFHLQRTVLRLWQHFLNNIIRNGQDVKGGEAVRFTPDIRSRPCYSGIRSSKQMANWTWMMLLFYSSLEVYTNFGIVSGMKTPEHDFSSTILPAGISVGLVSRQHLWRQEKTVLYNPLGNREIMLGRTGCHRDCGMGRKPQCTPYVPVGTLRVRSAALKMPDSWAV